MTQPVTQPSTQNGKIDKLEALRGLAALYVVIHHTLPHKFELAGLPLAYLWRFGQEAVILFFLLSGFVIKFSFEKSRNKQFGNYFSKRFYRIFIPLVVVFAIGYLANSYNAGHWINPDLPRLLGNLFMLQDFATVKPNVLVQPYMGNDPLWSLSFEWWFYMLFFPLTTYIRSERWRDNTVFTLSVVSAALYVVEPNFLTRLCMYLGIWWSGVYLAQCYLRNDLDRPMAIAKPLLTLVLIAVAMLVNVLVQRAQGAHITFGYYPVLELRHTLFAVVALVSAWLWRRSHWVLFDTLIKPFVVLAPISYVVYISHYHLFTSATYFAFVGNAFVEWLMYFAVTLGVSYLIELQIYPRVRRVLTNWQKRRSVTASPAG